MKTIWTLLGCAVLVAACGGGGGGDDDEPQPSDGYDLAQAQLNFAATRQRYTLVGQGPDGVDVEAVLAIEPAADGAFPLTGEVVQRARQTLRITIDGEETANTVSWLYYRADTGVQLGSMDEEDGSCTRVDRYTVLPDDADEDYESASDAETMTVLDGCDEAAETTHTVTARWYTRVADDAVFLCNDSSVRDAGGEPVVGQAECFEVEPDGTLGGKARITLRYPGWDPIVLGNY